MAAAKSGWRADSIPVAASEPASATPSDAPTWRLVDATASDATIVTLGHALDVLVRREAPGVALHFIGSLLDIGVQYGVAPDLRIQVLFHDEMVPVVRKDHPLAHRRVAPARLAALDHIAVASQRAKLDELTRHRRRQRCLPPSRFVPSFLAAAALVRASDAYTLLPSRLAAVIVGAFELCRLSVAGRPTKIAIAQAWSPRLDNDAGHIWIRGCVRRTCEAKIRTGEPGDAR